MLVVLTMLVPASSFAGLARLFTFPSGNKSLQYMATVGETNDVKLERVFISRPFPQPPRVRYRITESGPGATMSDGDGSGGCSVSGQVATCPTTNVTQTEITLTSGNDKATNNTSLGGRIAGGRNVDALAGGSGNDFVFGGGESDTLEGGAGDDQMFGDDGGAIPNGDDSFHGGPGADSFAGGGASDTALYSDRTSGLNVDLDGNPDDGDASDESAGARDNVGGDIETVAAGSGNDSLTGTAGFQILSGVGGDDTLDGGAGPDSLLGGNDTDTASYAARSQPVAVDLLDPFDDGGAEDDSGSGVRDSLDEVENVLGGAGGDSLTGDAGPNRLQGEGGADLLRGIDGPDLLLGGDAGDRLFGGVGTDDMRGQAADDRLDGGFGGDDMSGGDGTDTAAYAGRAAGVRVDLDSVADDGNADDGARTDNVRSNVENVSGGNGADSLTGNAFANVLTGGLGGDTINGRDGTSRRDELRCGPGSDRFRRDGSDQLFACEQAF